MSGTKTDLQLELHALIGRLKDRQSIRHMADCKCGHCQLVDVEDLRLAILLLASLSRRLEASP